MRNIFFISIPIVFVSILIIGYLFGGLWFMLGMASILLVVGLYDILQKKHTILRNFPILGHFRYMFESISPEIQQYFIERNTDGRPFSRHDRALVYQRAKNVIDTRAFGTQLDLEDVEYEGLK